MRKISESFVISQTFTFRDGDDILDVIFKSNGERDLMEVRWRAYLFVNGKQEHRAKDEISSPSEEKAKEIVLTLFRTSHLEPEQPERPKTITNEERYKKAIEIYPDLDDEVSQKLQTMQRVAWREGVKWCQERMDF